MVKIFGFLATTALVTAGPVVLPLKIETDYNFVGPSGNDGYLSSTLDCTLGVCTVYNEFAFFGPYDGKVVFTWTGADNSVLLSGQIPWDFTLFGDNTAPIGRRSTIEYLSGIFPGPNPTFSQLTGVADFTHSITINPPCLSKICKADYLELPHVSPFSTIHPSVIRAFSSPLTTVWAVSDLVVPTGSRFGTVPDEQTLTRFTDTVEQIGTAYRYIYTISNLSDVPLAFDFDKLNWSGNLNGHGSLTEERISSIGPELISDTGRVDFGSGGNVTASVDMLQPVQGVPEPRSCWLFVSGLALIYARRDCARWASCSRMVRRRWPMRPTRRRERWSCGTPGSAAP